MKKLFIKLSALLLPFMMVSLLAFAPLPEDYAGYAILDKNKLLKETKSPKIIIIGGSGAAMGVDSKKLSEAARLPVINMSTTVTPGLGRMLFDILDEAKKGDILLILPEYVYFTNYWNGESGFEFSVITKKLGLLSKKGFYELPPNSFMIYLREHIKGLLLSLKPKSPESLSRYDFNEYGDNTGYIKHIPKDESEGTPVEQTAGKPGSIGSINDYYITCFQNCINEFYKKGVKVLLSYPAYEEPAFYASEDSIDELDGKLKRIKHLTVISKPEGYAFPIRYILNGGYHLNPAGRELRTQRLIKDLRAAGL